MLVKPTGWPVSALTTRPVMPSSAIASAAEATLARTATPAAADRRRAPSVENRLNIE